jgi:polar amino acid transport system substrate-binding protein
MKKLAMAVLTLAMVITPFMARGDEITIAADQWCPYNCDPASDLPGYFVEIADVIFKNQGHSVKYVVLDWETAIKEARNGKYTGIIGAMKEDAPDFIYPEYELGVSENHFFVNKGDPWRYAGIESLKGKRVGVIEGYAYGETLDKFFKDNPNVQFTPGEDALDKNFEKLLSKQIDVLVEDQNVFMLKAMTLHILSQIIDGGDTGKDDKLYIAFSPAHAQSKAYARILSDGIQEMRKNGKFSVILDKYGLKDWR